jgi:acyl-CoA reductase-like NAD-dependent aldehyde dehydrogenase
MTEKTATFARKNPLTGEIASRARAMTVAEAGAVVDAAATKAEAWAGIGPSARRALLNAAAEGIKARADDFVAAMRDEIGATEGWARFNVMLAAGVLTEAAALTTHIKGEVIASDKPGVVAMALREPLGVVLGIAPWNAPVILGVRAIASALACGNCVVFKASETCPRTHEIIVEALLAAGIPEGVVGVVTNAPEDAAEIVGALIDHPAIKHVNFTGSSAVGRIVGRRAVENFKPVLLELGGKAPLVVLDDADLDEAVKAAAFGAFMNQGQICMSTERIVVVESVAAAFVDKLVQKARSLEAGDPRQGAAPLGALVDDAARTKVEGLIADAVAKGARRLVGEAGEGVLMPACVVAGVTPAMQLYSEESFGPVVAVITAKDEDDAVRIANDTRYGLSAAVFTKDIARGLKVARRIHSGMCHVNGPTVHDEPQMPFGGVGWSGFGRFGGTAAIEEFTTLRWITFETEPGHYLI